MSSKVIDVLERNLTDTAAHLKSPCSNLVGGTIGLAVGKALLPVLDHNAQATIFLTSLTLISMAVAVWSMAQAVPWMITRLKTSARLIKAVHGASAPSLLPRFRRLLTIWAKARKN